MKLAYEAYNQSGQAVQGTVEALTLQDATERLYREGLYIFAIHEDNQGEPGRLDGASRARGGSGKLKDLASFTRQLAVLTSTGTPVVQALAAVERQIKPGKWRSILQDVREKVEEGQSLVEAMSGHPRAFKPVYRSLIAAGESGGQLSKMLERLAVMTRQQMRIQHTVVGALTYPVLLIGVSVIVLIVMLTLVLPQFAGLFKTLDTPLPPTTAALMALSNTLRTRWWAFVLGAVVSLGSLCWWGTSRRARLWFDGFVVSAPVVGRFARSMVTARIVRILGVLLDGRVPMLEAIRLTQQSAGNARYGALLDRAEQLVTRGEPMSLVMKDSPLINASVYEAVQTGERTGQIAPILLSIADFMDEDNEVVLKSLTSLLEPVILIVLGAIVGFVAISMFMPLFDLTAAAQG